MTRGFEDCHHVWILKDGAWNIWQSTYQCLKDCNAIITLQEKCALEQTEALEKSLKIQEKSLYIAKNAMIISAIAMVVSVVWLWLEKILK